MDPGTASARGGIGQQSLPGKQQQPMTSVFLATLYILSRVKTDNTLSVSRRVKVSRSSEPHDRQGGAGLPFFSQTPAETAGTSASHGVRVYTQPMLIPVRRRSSVTLPAGEHHHPLTSTELYCLGDTGICVCVSGL